MQVYDLFLREISPKYIYMYHISYICISGIDLQVISIKQKDIYIYIYMCILCSKLSRYCLLLFAILYLLDLCLLIFFLFVFCI